MERCSPPRALMGAKETESYPGLRFWSGWRELCLGRVGWATDSPPGRDNLEGHPNPGLDRGLSDVSRPLPGHRTAGCIWVCTGSQAPGPMLAAGPGRVGAEAALQVSADSHTGSCHHRGGGLPLGSCDPAAAQNRTPTGLGGRKPAPAGLSDSSSTCSVPAVSWPRVS